MTHSENNIKRGYTASKDTDSTLNSNQKNDPMAFSEETNPFSLDAHQIRIPTDWTPLIERKERFDALNYGYSFGSKKVNMGPAFLNLKVMCQCLARAIMKHLQFSQGKYLFLDDLKAADNIFEDIEFSYKFNKNLKLSSPTPASA